MKRLPKKISGSASNRFLRFSLKTDLPLDAVVRAGCLLAVYEQREPEIVDAVNKKDITPEQALALLREMLRAELNRILVEQNSDCALSDQEAYARIEALENENKALNAAMRKRLVQHRTSAASGKGNNFHPGTNTGFARPWTTGGRSTEANQ
nr:hypothetical protein [Ruegeria sp. Ofav3-42]